MFRLEFGGAFPWVREHKCPVAEPGKPVLPWQSHKAWVRLKDGRLGVIDHFKSDGNFGVRPMNPDGTYFPNPSTHWTDIARAKIPEEVAVSSADLIYVRPDEVPETFRREISD